MMTRLLSLILCVLFGQVAIAQTNWYVRPSSSGSNDGSNWSNAWNIASLNSRWSSVQPGDTVWLAGGTYTSQLVPTKSGSSGNYISVKRVLRTDSVPVAAAGWNSSFDSAVDFETSGQACIYYGSKNIGSYMIFDGRVPSGIKLHSADSASYTTTGSFVVHATAGGGQSYIILTNIDCSGPFGAGPGSAVGDNGVLNINGCSYITFANCLIHGCSTIAFIDKSDHVTFDHCKIYDSVVGGAAHQNIFFMLSATEIVVKFCEVSNWAIEGFWMNGDCGAFYVYGNIFRDPYVTPETYVNRIFQAGSYQNTSGVQGPVYCYNNTFVQCTGGIWWDPVGGVAWASGTAAKNNIIWQSTGWSPAGVTRDYNYSDGSLGESHSINGSGQSPFTNLTGRDLHIVSGITSVLPRNKGVSIPAASGQTLNLDPDRNTRGADGVWDIGAYESWPTNLYITPAITSLTNGTCTNLHAWGRYPDGGTNELTTNGVTWASSAGGFISITTNGVICTTNNGGGSYISATYGSVTTSRLITNSPATPPIDIIPPSILEIHQTRTNGFASIYWRTDEQCTNILDIYRNDRDPPIASITNASRSYVCSNHVATPLGGTNWGLFSARLIDPSGNTNTPELLRSLDGDVTVQMKYTNRPVAIVGGFYIEQ